jgi:hypothetical protein
MATSVIPNTFGTIELEPDVSAGQPFSKFVEELLEKLRIFKEERFAYYEDLRKKNTKWANGSRSVLALLGSIAFLLTGLAAALRFSSEVDVKIWGISSDKVALLAVLTIYAVMGAISFYERGTDKTTAYFRHVGIILAIRDLWTKVQFEFLKELTALKAAANPPAGEPAARERIRALAEGFCNDLNKAATGELTEWRTEFLTFLSELEKGSDEVTKQIQEVAKAAEKSAADAKTAAEKAAIAAEAAAKAAQDAAKPGGVSLTVAGDFDDEVVISVDGAEAARSRGKTIALERVPPGPRKISARARKGTKELQAEYMVDVKPGLQDFKIAL